MTTSRSSNKKENYYGIQCTPWIYQRQHEDDRRSAPGVVEARVNGKKEVLSVTIKPEAVDPEDVEMLQDLVVSAVNEALRQAGEAMEQGMNNVTGGLNLGAFGL